MVAGFAKENRLATQSIGRELRLDSVPLDLRRLIGIYKLVKTSRGIIAFERFQHEALRSFTARVTAFPLFTYLNKMST